MYLTKADYLPRITATLLNLLLQEDETVLLEAASKMAVDTISVKAGVLYDISEVFTKTGEDRDGYILGIATSIGLYELYQRIEDYQVPDKVIKNYDDAIDTLQAISTGKEPLNLPPKSSGDAEGGGSGDETAQTVGIGLRRIGSQAKRTHNI